MPIRNVILCLPVENIPACPVDELPRCVAFVVTVMPSVLVHIRPAAKVRATLAAAVQTARRHHVNEKDPLIQGGSGRYLAFLDTLHDASQAARWLLSSTCETDSAC